MPNVTTTIRELKNVNTGLDLSIPHYTEKHGLLKNLVTCNIVAVSNLQCFKDPQHSNMDVVQFMVIREYDDFENLRKKLVAKFPGTNLPPLPKTLFSFVEGSIKEQVMSLEKFLKFIAATKKLATSSDTIEFLGFSKSSVRKVESKTRTDLFEESSDQTGLFGEEHDDEDDDNEDLFRSALVSQKDGGHSKASTKEVKLFEEQDYGDRVAKDDQLAMFTDVSDEPKMKQLLNSDMDKEEDLFITDNSLDDLSLQLTKSETTNVEQTSHREPAVKPSQDEARPKLSPKPASLKPSIPPKPFKTVKDTANKQQETSVKMEANLFGDSTQAELGATDILKYIEDNSQESGDVDLFS